MTNGLEIDGNLNTCGSRRCPEPDAIAVFTLKRTKKRESLRVSCREGKKRSKCQRVQVETRFSFLLVVSCRSSTPPPLPFSDGCSPSRHSRGIYLIDTHFLTHLCMFFNLYSTPLPHPPACCLPASLECFEQLCVYVCVYVRACVRTGYDTRAQGGYDSTKPVRR